MAEDTPADRVRQRIARWLDLTGQSQAEFAEACGEKTQVWLQKILAGENDVRLRYLDEIARAMRTTASELVRQQDSERYQLELTPSEVRLVEFLRRDREALDVLLQLFRLTDARRKPPAELPPLRASRDPV